MQIVGLVLNTVPVVNLFPYYNKITYWFKVVWKADVGHIHQKYFMPISTHNEVKNKERYNMGLVEVIHWNKFPGVGLEVVEEVEWSWRGGGGWAEAVI